MSVPIFREVRIENTNACGYKCVMCPREKQTRQIGYMPIEDFTIVLDRVTPFQGSFHLHGFGEPLLDRMLSKKIHLVKQRFPQALTCIFSTLGVRLSEERLRDLVTSGLDFLNVSLYGFSKESYAKVHGFAGLDLVKSNLELLSKFIKEQNSHLRVHVKVPAPQVASSLPMLETTEAVSFCKWVESLGLEIAVWQGVHNYGNGREYNKPEQNRLCPVIEGMRRNILHVTWDLRVIPCCYDFNATIPFGSLRTQTLQEIFSSPEYLRFVLAHKTDDLSHYPVCQGCEKYDY